MESPTRVIPIWYAVVVRLRWQTQHRRPRFSAFVYCKAKKRGRTVEGLRVCAMDTLEKPPVQYGPSGLRQEKPPTLGPDSSHLRLIEGASDQVEDSLLVRADVESVGLDSEIRRSVSAQQALAMLAADANATGGMADPSTSPRSSTLNCGINRHPIVSITAEHEPNTDATSAIQQGEIATSKLSTPGFLPSQIANHLRKATHGNELPVARRKKRTTSGKFRRRVSSVLKMAGINVLEDESDKVRGLWEVFDVDGDGIIDYAEFCRYTCDLIELQKKKKTQSAMTSVEAKFVRIVILEIMQLGTLQKAIESVFRMIDTNRSGKISQLEFEDGIRALGIMDFNYEVHGQKRRFADTSLFILPVGSTFRYCAVWLVEWKWFDRLILTCIIINSAMLAFRDYQDPGSIPDANGVVKLSMRNTILDQAEAIFSWIFVAECGLKIMAMGFLFGRGAYLRNYWNMLDFFVVVIGLIGDLPGVPKVSALRTARVLRPLRTLSNLRRMRMLVYALLSAIPALFNVMVILSFVFTVFGILGVLFWNGILYNRCRTTPSPVDGVWALADGGRLCGGGYTCPENQFCGSVYAPPEGSYIDRDKISPQDKWDYALVGFDNIGKGMLTLFQCITLEGWTAVMYNMQDAHSYAFATIYFVLFTIIGALFLLQFVFAVIWERFNAANDGTAGEWDLILEERRASAASANVSPPAGKRDSSIAERRTEMQKQSSIRQSIRASIHSGMVIVKRNNPVHRIRTVCRAIAKDNRFGHFIVCCILLNTATLAMDEYPVDPKRESAMEYINTGLTLVFSAEMVLKLIGMGFKEYRSDRLNIFDGCIVCVSLAEFLMKLIMTNPKSATGLSALRSFRLFRIMKLARSWRSLRELLQTIGNSLADVANFGMLLLLLMYVFALIGMQFFANKYRFDDSGNPVVWQPHVYTNTTPPHAPWTPERPYTISRSNFDDTVAAFTTVFQCLTEENWVSVMYNGVRSSGWNATLYFLLVMVVGNIIILNLFLAILLGNFSVDEQIEETELKVAQGERQIQAAIVKVNAVVPVDVAPSASLAPEKDHPQNDHRERRRRKRRHHTANSVGSVGRNSVGRNSVDQASHGRDSESVAGGALSFHPKTASASNKSNGSESSCSDADGSEAISATRRASGNPRHVPLVTMNGRHTKPGVRFNSVAPSPGSMSAVLAIDRNRSLFLFSRIHFARRMCNKVIRHKLFEGLMLIFIFLSSAQLCIDNPLNDPSSQLSTVLTTLDKVFTLVFLIEMVLKVIDMGFLLNGKTSYLRDPWNVLDFGILICSSITLFSSNKTLRSLRSLRTLRAMRPLRMISRVPGMRRVVNALLSSIPSIMNVFLVCSLIFLIFGIIGVNLFKGRLFYCDMSLFSDDKIHSLEQEFGFTKLSFRKLFSKQDCIDNGGVWSQQHRHYDNVFKSAMTLFELSTTEGWVDVMFQGVDATEIGYHPVQNYNRSYIAFFIVFIIIGSFFTMNLFVGAVIDNFNRMRDTLNYAEADNETQREWLQIQEALRGTRLIAKPKEPANKIRRFCYHLQQHRTFEALIAVSVLGNTIMLAITHFEESPTIASLLSIGNIFFWFVFFVEATIKLLSLGHEYFLDRWNIFDFAVVCGSTVSTVLPFFTNGKISPVANTLRAFRMGLAVRMIKRAKSMQDIVNTILDNMSALVNVSTLMFLIIFVYAVIGVQLYAGVKLGDNLNEHANFQGIVVAIVTLFRFATGEAWNDVMYDLMVQPDDGNAPYPNGTSCVPDFTYSQLQEARNYSGNPNLTIGCSPGIAVTYIYFLTYELVASYVLINLFVAVILEGFEETTEKNLSTVTKADLRQVCAMWEKYDPFATGYMSDHHFLKFLRDIPPPLGLPKPVHRRDLARWARQLDLLLDSTGRISFNAFILSATQSLMARVAEERGDEIVPARTAESFFARSQILAKVAKSRRGSTTPSNLFVIICIKRIQAAMRSRIARKRFLELKKQLAAQRIALYDAAAMSNFKGMPIEDEVSNDPDKANPQDANLPDAQRSSDSNSHAESPPLPDIPHEAPVHGEDPSNDPVEGGPSSPDTCTNEPPPAMDAPPIENS